MSDIISSEAAWKDRALKAEAELEATKSKPEALVKALCEGLWSEAGLSISTKEIRVALEARGLEIRSKNDE